MEKKYTPETFVIDNGPLERAEEIIALKKSIEHGSAPVEPPQDVQAERTEVVEGREVDPMSMSSRRLGGIAIFGKPVLLRSGQARERAPESESSDEASDAQSSEILVTA